jgi:hypothetical protein
MPRLPLLLLAGMLATAVVIEIALYGTLLWQTKLPLAALLAWAWLAPARRRESR